MIYLQSKYPAGPEDRAASGKTKQKIKQIILEELLKTILTNDLEKTIVNPKSFLKTLPRTSQVPRI